MSGYPVVEVLLVALIVGWSARHAWRELAPAIRASLQRREAGQGGKACGSACGGCGSGESAGTKREA